MEQKHNTPGAPAPTVKSPYTKALLRLAKVFKVEEHTFAPLPRHVVIQWAVDTYSPAYRLATWQHQFLVGEAPTRYPRKQMLVERLSPMSLAAAASVGGGRTIQQMCSAAGVRV